MYFGKKAKFYFIGKIVSYNLKNSKDNLTICKFLRSTNKNNRNEVKNLFEIRFKKIFPWLIKIYMKITKEF